MLDRSPTELAGSAALERDAGGELEGGEGEDGVQEAVAGEGGEGERPDQVPGEEPGGGEEQAEGGPGRGRTQSPPRQVQSERGR